MRSALQITFTSAQRCTKKKPVQVRSQTLRRNHLLWSNRLPRIICGPGGSLMPYQEERPHPKNTLNEMSGDRFLYFTKSVITTSFPSVYSHELRKKHGANKPPQLMALLIEFFTKTGMSVLDPFAGVGGTLIGASIATPGPRKCVGIEINQQWTNIYARVLKENPDLLPQAIIPGDCSELMDRLLSKQSVIAIDGQEVRAGGEAASFDFIVMDPPYNIHLEQTMSGNGGKQYAENHSNRRSDYNMRSDKKPELANLLS